MPRKSRKNQPALVEMAETYRPAEQPAEQAPTQKSEVPTTYTYGAYRVITLGSTGTLMYGSMDITPFVLEAGGTTDPDHLRAVASGFKGLTISKASLTQRSMAALSAKIAATRQLPLQ